MAVINVNPTRMELSRLKKRLSVALKGHRLLKDKRDELMRQFLELVRSNKLLREEVEDQIIKANQGFALASALMQKEVFVSALMIPKQEVKLSIEAKNIMSVNVPQFKIDKKAKNEGDMFSYGYAFTSSELDESVAYLSKVLPKLLELAQKEKTVQMLAGEIEKTRRRVNALEHVMIPNYKDTIRYITMKLDENERGSLTRLMKVKDMMVREKIESEVK